jgi:lysine 2,3-aminomutase
MTQHRAAPVGLADVAARYAVAITPTMEALIDTRAPHDPIAAQFLPDIRELTITPDQSPDPIDDGAHTPIKGLVHRYADRVLLKVLHVCPVYCRFCFRRDMVGPDGDGALVGEDLDAALAYIAADPAIWEVILTGGDPFMLSPRRIEALMARLNAIAHVRVVRWHTRVPLVDPERVTAELVRALRLGDKAVWVAVHANHPREFSPAGVDALARLADGGIALVSQTVLLAGINDNAETLEQLMRLFVQNRVKPYYLHHLDAAQGTAHFHTPIETGQALMRALHARASGLCQPTYVLDIPGGACKAPIGPVYLHTDGSTRRVCDDAGHLHHLSDHA